MVVENQIAAGTTDLIPELGLELDRDGSGKAFAAYAWIVLTRSGYSNWGVCGWKILEANCASDVRAVGTLREFGSGVLLNRN